MADWIPMGEDLTEADVIRWREGIFSPRERRKGNRERLGQRLITAELLEKGGDWLRFKVCACELIAFRGRDLPEGFFRLREGSVTKRRPRTIMKGAPERMAWSDEGARSAVIGPSSIVVRFRAASL